MIHLGSFVRERRSLSLHERAASTIGLTARKMALSTLLAALIIDMLAHSMLLPVLPFYIVERGGTGADVGVCFSLFALWQGPGAFLAARLSDRVGRKPMLMLAYLGSAVGHALTASASGLLTLYVGRAVLGAFSSAVRAAGVHPDWATMVADCARVGPNRALDGGGSARWPQEVLSSALVTDCH